MIGEYLVSRLETIEGRTPGMPVSVVIHVDRVPAALWIHIEED